MNRRDLLLGTALALLSTKARALSPQQTLLLQNGGVRPTYFVSLAGNDSNDGRSRLTSWKTLTKVNASTFNPGDFIAFCGGQNFSGSLVVPSSGSAAGAITFGSYGAGVATITPSAANTPGVTCLNQQYITIRDLIIVGQSQTTDLADGVHVENNQGGNTKLQGISLINLNVSLFSQNGINVIGTNGTSGFNSVVINNCIAHDCAGGPSSGGTSGITVGSPGGYGSASSHTNVTISNCTAFNNIGKTAQPNWTGTGIIIHQTNGGLIQSCVAHDNGASGDGAVGIWTADSNAVTIQFCEVYNQVSSTTTDGGGFDIDGGCTNCVLQYNYSHGNKGPGFMLFSYNDGTVTTWNNNTCRYNISENDGASGGGGAPPASAGGISVQSTSTMTNAFVYNNTVYSNVGKVFTVLNSMTGNIANNIFYATSTNNIVQTDGATALNFTGNDYFSTGTFSISWNGTGYSTFAAWQTATSQEKISGVNVGFNVDPLLTSPGSGGTVGGYNPPNPTAYKLQSGSPMLGTGLNLNTQFSINPGTRDYYGNLLSGAYPVGAYAGPVIPLLLDTLAASASVAYSTRKLRAVYAGFALRVQTSAAGNATQDIGFVNGQLDTASLLSFLGSNSGTVTIWYDQSGNGLNATPVGAPRIVNAGSLDTLNSHAALRFGILGNAGLVFTASLAQPTTIALVAKHNSQVANGHYTDGNVASPRQLIGIISPNYVQYAGASVLTGGTIDLLSHSIIGIFNGASSGVAVDGSTLITGNPGTNGIGSQIIGAGNGGSGVASMDGWLPEYIVFASALGAPDQALIRASNQAYWGTP